MRNLKGAQQAFGEQLVRGKARDIDPAHGDAARCGRQPPGYYVEKSGFSCAIGADKPGDGAGFDLQRRAIDGMKAPEMLVQVFNANHAIPLESPASFHRDSATRAGSICDNGPGSTPGPPLF